MDNYLYNSGFQVLRYLDGTVCFYTFASSYNGTWNMARPVTVTKGKILAAALDMVRANGLSVLTARNLCAALGCGVNPIFSAYGSIQGVRNAVRDAARELYLKRVSAGFSLKPPFKGFGVALIWFAMDEPKLFSLIMEAEAPTKTIENYIDTYVGFKPECLAAIESSFGLSGHESETLYYQMVMIALGLAHSCTGGACELSIPQVSEILGRSVRAFLMVIRAGTDEREKFIPKAGGGPEGDVDSYLLMQTLAGQNHLLEQLHSVPRYIQDDEWAELERVFRNSSNLTVESLKEATPGLTKGDIRVYILSHLQFSVSQQAVLLGISPASVTKARQRLKAKIVNKEIIHQ